MLEHRFDAYVEGSWKSLAKDLVPDAGMQAGRGIRGNRPDDVLADAGEGQFALDNTEQNEGGIEGWYTLGHPNVRTDWDFGTPIRFVLVLNGVDHVRWTGTLAGVLPEAFASGLRAHVQVKDIMETLAAEEIRSVAPQHDKTEVELLDAALDSLPVASQPVARNFDTAVTQFTYAFHDLGSGQGTVGVLNKVMLSAQGCGWPLADGSLHYENKISRRLRASRYHFTDGLFQKIDVPTTLQEVFNRFRFTIHPKDDPEALIVIWRSDGAITLAPGETQDLWVTYRNPDNDQQLIGAFYIEPLDSGVDFTGNAQEDGGGADKTADLDVDMSAFSSTANLTIENTSGDTVYIPAGALQIRGKAIFDRSPITREGYTPRPYGSRLFLLDLLYRNDDPEVQLDADYLSASYSDRKGQATNLEFIAEFSEEFEELACTLDIGEAITVTEPKSALFGKGFFIQAIDWLVDASGILRVVLGLAPRIVVDETHEDTVYVHDRLYALVDAPEDAIGFMRIGFSEIGA